MCVRAFVNVSVCARACVCRYLPSTVSDTPVCFCLDTADLEDKRTRLRIFMETSSNHKNGVLALRADTCFEVDLSHTSLVDAGCHI